MAQEQKKGKQRRRMQHVQPRHSLRWALVSFTPPAQAAPPLPPAFTHPTVHPSCTPLLCKPPLPPSLYPPAASMAGHWRAGPVGHPRDPQCRAAPARGAAAGAMGSGGHPPVTGSRATPVSLPPPRRSLLSVIPMNFPVSRSRSYGNCGGDPVSTATGVPGHRRCRQGMPGSLRRWGAQATPTGDSSRDVPSLRGCPTGRSLLEHPRAPGAAEAASPAWAAQTRPQPPALPTAAGMAPSSACLYFRRL